MRNHKFAEIGLFAAFHSNTPGYTKLPTNLSTEREVTQKLTSITQTFPLQFFGKTKLRNRELRYIISDKDYVTFFPFT